MRTPKYKQAPIVRRSPSVEQAPTPADASSAPSAGTITGKNGEQWRLIQPSKDRPAALAKLRKSGQIQWSGGSKKPFNVNEKTRRQLSGHILRIAAKHKLDPHLLHAVISAESAFNPQAVSHAGAMGLMQLMPGTAKRFGVHNPFDPVSNINGGARYLRWLLTKFKSDVRLALAGYNAGEGAVIKYGYKIPPYKETKTYVVRVLKFYNHYRNRQS